MSPFELHFPPTHKRIFLIDSAPGFINAAHTKKAGSGGSSAVH